MKFTEGGFKKWGYEVAAEEFGEEIASGKLVIKDCICDAFLQNALLKPEDYSVIATLNLNGDYVSDMLAAQVGGIGIAPGANINYYTGAIFEVKALDVQIGSITGGGRYDNLTGIFGMPGLSGVGISFGADRIFDVLNQLDLYPKETATATRLLFVNFGEAEAAYSLPILAQVRAAGISAEIYPDAVKMKKQMSYANQKQIPYVAIVGETEMAQGKVMLKNMQSGEQQLLGPDELVAAVRL